MSRRNIILLAVILLLLLTGAMVTFWGAALMWISHIGSASQTVQMQQRAYMAAEGHSHRGKHFEQLAVAFSKARLSQPAMTADEVIALLGPPDLQDDAADGDTTYIYLYDRFASKDACMIVNTERHQVTSVGFNARAQLDLSPFKPYGDPPVASKPVPAK